MKLVHVSLNQQIDFEKHQFYSLVIENPREFFKLTSDLYTQSTGGEGIFVLSDRNEILPMEKHALFLHDYYGLTCNTKKNESLLNSTLLGIVNNDDYIELVSRVNQDFILLNDKLLKNFDMTVSYDELTIEKLVKLANYKFVEEIDFLEKLVTLIDLNVKIRKIKFVIFVNLFAIMDEADVKKLLKQLHYMEVNALFIDISQHKIDCLRTIIIDKDLCEI